MRFNDAIRAIKLREPLSIERLDGVRDPPERAW